MRNPVAAQIYENISLPSIFSLFIEFILSPPLSYIQENNYYLIIFLKKEALKMLFIPRPEMLWRCWESNPGIPTQDFNPV